MKQEENLPIHRKYRPTTFEEMYGNKTTIKLLEKEVEKKTVTTFLLHGKRGTGKTTAARILANGFDASDMNIYEFNISNQRGIDQARSIIEMMRFVTFDGKSRVMVLNECHRATPDFQHAMLEALEEPKPNNYFILCTTEPKKLLKTIRSRCEDYEFKELMKRDMLALLNDICDKEDIDVSDELLNKISDMTDGIPREALVLLGKVFKTNNDEEAEEVIESHLIITDDMVENIELINALKDGKSWKTIREILKGIEDEPESIRWGVLNYMSKVLLSSDGDRAERIFLILEEFKDTFIYSKKPGLYCACYACTKF